MTEVIVLASGLGTVVSLLIGLKALKRDQTKDLVIAVFTDERWEKIVEKLLNEAREAGRLAAADRVQVMINPKDYMPREVQELTNKEIFRRLAAVEKKIDDVPEATAEQVMIKLREAQR